MMKTVLKRIFCAAVTIAVSFSSGLVGACKNVGDSSTSVNIMEKDYSDCDATAFSLQKFTSPLWKGDVSYCEAAFAIEDENGTLPIKKTAYPIEKIISVRSADLATLYEEGKDYEIVDKCLKIKKDGAIPYLKYADYHFDVYVSDGLNTRYPSSGESGAYIYAEAYNGRKGMSQWCLAVTYAHYESDAYAVPADQSVYFSKTIEKLEKGEDVKIAVYGDSISYGWGATGTAEVNIAPHCPKYCDLFADYLKAEYSSQITEVNLSVSGKTSDWAAGYENCKRVFDEKPDLLILAFGMNDGTYMEPGVYIQQLRRIISAVTRNSENTEVLLVGSMVPNGTVGYEQNVSLLKYQDKYPAYLKQLSDELEVGFADVTDFQLALLKRKIIQDMSSNNAQHPNDFMHRLYAQIALRAVLGDKFA